MSNTVDPVTLEVLRSRLNSIAEEMQATLVRSAFSNIIKEGHDASAAVFTANGEMVAQATALPAQLGVLIPAVRRLLEVFPISTMSAGDAFILNDPYDGGTHLPDIAVMGPVMVDNEVVALVASIAHHQDVGGKTPGSIPTDATEIYQEGLRIPPLRLARAGVADESIYAIIARNVRVPEIVLGDLGAQLSAMHVGQLRTAKVARASGVRAFDASISELLSRSELLTRACIAAIPNGEYSFEDYVDNDGIQLDRLIRIRATVHIIGDDMVVDFNGTDAQVEGPLNADVSAVHSAVYYFLRAVTDSTIPNNAGCYRPLQLRLPEGTVVNPFPGAPVNGRTVTMKRICDTLLGAMVPALPDRIPAAPSGLTRVIMFGGTDPSSGDSFVCTDFSTGGTGGQPSADGVDSLETDIANTMNVPAEALEIGYPLRVLKNALWRDSAGAGRWRGGLGVERVVQVLSGPVTMTLREDRHRTQPWGLFGGLPAKSCRAEVLRAGGSRLRVPSKGVYKLQTGDVVQCRGAGGAGYGDPLERDPTLVADDVADRKVSPGCAADEYGVVMKGRTPDLARTVVQRDLLKADRGDVSWVFDRGQRGKA